MPSPMNFVLNEVNLESYSASPGFVGYFERAGRYVDGLAEDAVALLAEKMVGEWEEWTLVSSLHANQDEVGHCGDLDADARDTQLVDFLQTHNVLKKFSYSARFGTDYESQAYADAVLAACSDFIQAQVNSLDCAAVVKLLIARMLVYGLRGHCFLVSIQKGLILYPHDDTGFGIICFGSAPRLEVAYGLLNAAAQGRGFRSVIAP
jgi:hypothetical protein